MRKLLGILMWFLTATLSVLHAQTLSGTVTDAESGQPLEAVMISVLRNNSMVDYALTDAKGAYRLSWKYTGEMQVMVSLLGHRREVRTIHKPGVVHFKLQPEAIALQEVEIRPGRIHSRKDTVRYNLSDFASSNDVHIKDVLKKLPGVDVDEDGRVKYNGKAIDHYLVEGMDVSGGRYNQINNNLSAKAVQTAEIMENYQSTKALKGKIDSEDVALNLKLDPQARDQWIVNGSLGLGYGEELLWEGSLNALQLGRGSQSIYNYKANNSGSNLLNEQQLLINKSWQQLPLSRLLEQPGLLMPLDKKRLLFNETHTVNGNRMYKWGEDRTMRLQAGYTNDLIRQQRESVQIYYQPDDTLQVDEKYDYRMRSDAANIELHYEDNNAQNYIANRLTADMEIGESNSRELQQAIRTGKLSTANYFSLIRNGEKATWDFRSATRYAYLPASLRLSKGKQNLDQHSLYMDNQVSYLRKHNGLTRKYTAGMQGEWAEVASFRSSYTSLYIIPFYQLERGKWQGTLSASLKGRRYFSQQRSLLLFNPSLLLRYQLNYYWKFSLHSGFNRSVSEIADLYPTAYQTDYRTWRSGEGLLPTVNRQNYNLYGEYKNTAQEFFATATVGYNRTSRNTMYEQSVAADSILYTLRNISNHVDSWFLNTTLSKGVYEWKLKASLSLLASRNRGKQLTLFPVAGAQREGILQSYRSDYLQAEPKLSWNPASFFEMEYHATLGYSGTKIGGKTTLSSLLSVAQRLHCTFSIGSVDVRLSGEHYRNDLDNENHLTTWFADASLLYKVKKWRMSIALNNLLNKKEYAYTTYSATHSYMSRLNIRPREVLISANYQF